MTNIYDEQPEISPNGKSLGLGNVHKKPDKFANLLGYNQVRITQNTKMDFYKNLPALKFEFGLLNSNLRHRSPHCSHVRCFPPPRKEGCSSL